VQLCRHTEKKGGGPMREKRGRKRYFAWARAEFYRTKGLARPREKEEREDVGNNRKRREEAP